MKQITMDYETYELEIIEARKEGAEIIDGLYDALLDLTNSLSNGDRDNYVSATNKVNVILHALRKQKAVGK